MWPHMCVCVCVCVWCGVCWYIINNLFKTLFGNLLWRILRFCGYFIAIFQLRLLLLEHPSNVHGRCPKIEYRCETHRDKNGCSNWKSELRLTSCHLTCSWYNKSSRAPWNDLACGELCRSYFEQQAAQVRALYRLLTYLLTPSSRVILKKLTSKLCS